MRHLQPCQTCVDAHKWTTHVPWSPRYCQCLDALVQIRSSTRPECPRWCSVKKSDARIGRWGRFLGGVLLGRERPPTSEVRRSKSIRSGAEQDTDAEGNPICETSRPAREN